MKVIQSLKNIPEGSIVTKITGNKEYIVRSSIKIYGDKPQELKAQDGTRFLVANDGSISCLHGETELAWHVTEINFLRWLEMYINEENMDHK